jgi:tRNA(fMet)-specific endonuclease VapC
MRHLDTNVVIAYLNGNASVAARLLGSLPDIAISSLVLAELLYGARASARAAENLARLARFVQVIDIVDFDALAAEAYGQLRLELRRMGRPTGAIDALIAAVAIAHDAVLVTHNTGDFENIHGLTLEDWLSNN